MFITQRTHTHKQLKNCRYTFWFFEIEMKRKRLRERERESLRVIGFGL
jgi:hypothetical protein